MLKWNYIYGIGVLLILIFNLLCLLDIQLVHVLNR